TWAMLRGRPPAPEGEEQGGPHAPRVRDLRRRRAAGRRRSRARARHLRATAEGVRLRGPFPEGERGGPGGPGLHGTLPPARGGREGGGSAHLRRRGGGDRPGVAITRQGDLQ